MKNELKKTLLVLEKLQQANLLKKELNSTKYLQLQKNIEIFNSQINLLLNKQKESPVPFKNQKILEKLLSNYEQLVQNLHQIHEFIKEVFRSFKREDI